MTRDTGKIKSNGASSKPPGRNRPDTKEVMDNANEVRMNAYAVAVKRYDRRRRFGWLVLVLGVVTAIQHMVSHSEAWVLPLSSGLQDVLIGYPAAAGLALIAAVSLGQLHPSERKL